MRKSNIIQFPKKKKKENNVAKKKTEYSHPCDPIWEKYINLIFSFFTKNYKDLTANYKRPEDMLVNAIWLLSINLILNHCDDVSLDKAELSVNLIMKRVSRNVIESLRLHYEELDQDL